MIQLLESLAIQLLTTVEKKIDNAAIVHSHELNFHRFTATGTIFPSFLSVRSDEVGASLPPPNRRFAPITLQRSSALFFHAPTSLC
jgi:hypothetical protein